MVCRNRARARDRAGMTTAYITRPDCLRHEMGAEHPERPQRLAAIDEHLRDANLLEKLRCLSAPLAEPDDLKRVHAPEYVSVFFLNSPSAGYVHLVPYSLLNPSCLPAPRLYVFIWVSVSSCTYPS